MTTPDIPAALAAAQADHAAASLALQNAIRRTAELQAQLAKPKPFVRALEEERSGGLFSVYLKGDTRHLAIVNPRNCEALGVDPAEFANAVRLSMCMRDFVRRWNGPHDLNITSLGCWLVRELGLCDTKQSSGAVAAGSRFSGTRMTAFSVTTMDCE
jgi:hypothetical protein